MNYEEKNEDLNKNHKKELRIATFIFSETIDTGVSSQQLKINIFSVNDT